MVLFAWDPRAGVPARRGRWLAAAQPCAARALGLGIPGPPRAVAGTSPSGARSLCVAEPGRRPSSFSAPCRGRRPLHAPQTHRDLPVGGSAQAPGAVLPPARARCCSRGSRFLLSPVKGRPERGRRDLCRVCWGCARAPGGAPVAAEDRLAPCPGLFPWHSEEL